MQRNKSLKSRPGETREPRIPRDGIFLDRALANQLLTSEGATTIRARARALGLAVGTVSDLLKYIRPVGDEIIYAFKIRFPEVPYERLFKERQGVLCDARPTTDRAAA